MGEERVAGSEDGGRDVDRLLEATSALGATLGASSLEPIAQAVADQALRLGRARSVLVLLDEAGDLVVAAVAGEAPDAARSLREAADGAAWRGVMGGEGPERIEPVSGRLGSALAGIGAPATAALLVPLTVRNRAIGVVVALNPISGGAFSEADEGILSGFAAAAAMALAPIQALAETRLRESIEVAERERARWARELHDDTLQGLGALRVRLAAGLRRGGAQELDQVVREAVIQIEDEIAALRSLITELRPAALDELGLGAAIRSLAETSAAANDLAVHLDLALAHEDGVAPKRLDRELESALYRVIQEALTNVAKHAGAENVWIEVAEDDATILVVVRDDGHGFDMNERGRGFGLVGMRERIALQGGSLAIVSSHGTGTELRGRIPLGARER